MAELSEYEKGLRLRNRVSSGLDWLFAPRENPPDASFPGVAPTELNPEVQQSLDWLTAPRANGPNNSFPGVDFVGDPFVQTTRGFLRMGELKPTPTPGVAATETPTPTPGVAATETGPRLPTSTDRMIESFDRFLNSFPGRSKTDEQILKDNAVAYESGPPVSLAGPAPQENAKSETVSSPRVGSGYFKTAPLGSGKMWAKEIDSLLSVEPEKIKEKDVPAYRDALLKSMSSASYDAGNDPQVVSRVNGIIENMYAMKRQRAQINALKQQEKEAKQAFDDANLKARYGDEEEPNPARDKMYLKAETLRKNAALAHKASRESWDEEESNAYAAKSEELKRMADEVEQGADLENESGLNETSLWWKKRAQEIREKQLEPLSQQRIDLSIQQANANAAHYGETDLTRSLAQENDAQIQALQSRQIMQEMAARARQQEKEQKQAVGEQRRQESAQRAIGNRAIRFVEDASAPIKKEVADLEKSLVEVQNTLGIDPNNPEDLDALRTSNPQEYASVKQTLGRLNMKRRALQAYADRVGTIRNQYFPESAALAQVQIPQEPQTQASEENLLPGGFIARDIPQRGR